MSTCKPGAFVGKSVCHQLVCVAGVCVCVAGVSLGPQMRPLVSQRQLIFVAEVALVYPSHPSVEAPPQPDRQAGLLSSNSRSHN